MEIGRFDRQPHFPLGRDKSFLLMGNLWRWVKSLSIPWRALSFLDLNFGHLVTLLSLVNEKWILASLIFESPAASNLFNGLLYSHLLVFFEDISLKLWHYILRLVIKSTVVSAKITHLEVSIIELRRVSIFRGKHSSVDLPRWILTSIRLSGLTLIYLR